jgi:exosortase/archaeosortase family protein
LNSLIGLLAISLFYIYLVRGSSWRYSLLLAILAIPIAIIANVFRIIILILLTYFAGDAVAQGFLHFAAGLFIFITALLLVFLLDSLIHPLLRRRLTA